MSNKVENIILESLTNPYVYNYKLFIPTKNNQKINAVKSVLTLMKQKEEVINKLDKFEKEVLLICEYYFIENLKEKIDSNIPVENYILEFYSKERVSFSLAKIIKLLNLKEKLNILYNNEKYFETNIKKNNLFTVKEMFFLEDLRSYVGNSDNYKIFDGIIKSISPLSYEKMFFTTNENNFLKIEENSKKSLKFLKKVLKTKRNEEKETKNFYSYLLKENLLEECVNTGDTFAQLMLLNPVVILFNFLSKKGFLN